MTVPAAGSAPNSAKEIAISTDGITAVRDRGSEKKGR